MKRPSAKADNFADSAMRIAELEARLRKSEAYNAGDKLERKEKKIEDERRRKLAEKDEQNSSLHNLEKGEGEIEREEGGRCNAPYEGPWFGWHRKNYGKKPDGVRLCPT